MLKGNGHANYVNLSLLRRIYEALFTAQTHLSKTESMKSHHARRLANEVPTTRWVPLHINGMIKWGWFIKHLSAVIQFGHNIGLIASVTPLNDVVPSGPLKVCAPSESIPLPLLALKLVRKLTASVQPAWPCLYCHHPPKYTSLSHFVHIPSFAIH